MNAKHVLIVLSLSSLSFSVLAQNREADILRYSRADLGGTARTQAIGGAQTALGGDIGSLSSNPAGLGFFRRSDFSFSPTITDIRNNTSYLGNQYSYDKGAVNFANIGVVWARSTPQADEGKKSAGWLSYAFGLGYNRTNTYNSNFSFSGKNKLSSFTYYLADQANLYGINVDNSGNASDNTLAGQAYNAALINSQKNGNQTTYQPGTFPSGSNPANQSGYNYQAGRTDDVNISFGTNYGNQLYLGVGANLSTLRYSYAFNFLETGINNTQTPTINVHGLNYTENFDAAGTGVSAKAGLIYRPDASIRLGAYLQTPTWYHITEAVNNTMVSSTDATGAPLYTPAASNGGLASYDMKTPWKYNFGGSFFFKTFAFISADVELVDYKSASFHSADSVSLLINKNIQSIYRSAVNYRLGAEIKAGIFSFRAGYALYGNPYSATTLLSSATTSYTGGLGLRTGNFYADIAVINTQFNSPYTAYPIAAISPPSPMVSINSNRTDFVLTLGSRF